MNYRRWGYLLIIASITCVLIATLSPFGFVVPANLSPSVIFSKFNYISDIKDYWCNILLFIPLGISLAMILPENKLKYLKALTIAFVVSISLSFFVEFTQAFLPTRVSNIADIIANTLGGVLGAYLYLQRSGIIALTSAIIKRNKNGITIKSLLAIFTGYFCLIIFAVWILLTSVNFSNWDNNFYLTIGNETTGNRPWQGNITNLYMTDRAIESESVVKSFKQTHSFFSELPNLVTSLVFTDKKEVYQDITGNLPDLFWQGLPDANNITDQDKILEKSVIDSKIRQGKGISIDQDHWLSTKESAKIVNERLKKANEFSLSTIISTNQVQQKGPARIISISDGITSRNFTLGQDGTNLVFRLRTPITGNNGSELQFIVSDVFQDDSSHQILITFANQNLNFYIDRPENKYTFRFMPEISWSAYIPISSKNSQVNLKDFNLLKYRIIFYSILLIPLGFFGSLLFSRLELKSSLQVLSTITVCFLPVLLIECLYSFTSEQPIRIFNLLLGIFILLITTFAVKIFYLK